MWRKRALVLYRALVLPCLEVLSVPRIRERETKRAREMAHVRSGVEFERRVYDVDGENAVRCVVFDEQSRYVNIASHVLCVYLCMCVYESWCNAIREYSCIQRRKESDLKVSRFHS